MKRFIATIVCGSAAILGLASLAGCSASQRSGMLPQQTVALADLGPAEGTGSGSTQRGGMCLGAGDALGQAIFANYITVVRAASPELDAVYASGETNR